MLLIILTLSFLESNYLGTSLKVKMACRRLLLMLTVSFLESDHLSESLKVKIAVDVEHSIFSENSLLRHVLED